MTRLERIKAWGEIIALPLVAASAVAAVVGYLSDLRQQERQYTFALVERYHDEALTDARLSLFRRTALTQEQYPGVSLGAEDLGTLLAKQIEAQPALRSELEPALLRIADFFNSADDCLRAKLCSAPLMASLLQSEARTFICLFGPATQVLAARANVTGLLRGAQKIGGQCGDDGSSS